MGTPIIQVFAEWTVKAEHLETVLQLLPELASKSKAEKGNVYYKVYQDRSDPNVLLLNEAYQDEGAIAAHRASAHYQEIVAGQIVPLLENRQVRLTKELI